MWRSDIIKDKETNEGEGETSGRGKNTSELLGSGSESEGRAVKETMMIGVDVLGP